MDYVSYYYVVIKIKKQPNYFIGGMIENNLILPHHQNWAIFAIFHKN